MKKIFVLVGLFISLVSAAQPGYTTINARYNWLAGRFQALHIPGFNTTPSLASGQWPGDGAVGIDTAANIMYFYSGGTWRAVGTGTVGGSTTQVQYNNAGAFGGISGATTNGTVLTLTSPVINVTSDATGDVYYRSSGGAFTRLPIGTTGQQLTVSGGGLPSWAASGGSTPTLQQVLTAGSTLTGSNTIDVGSLNTFIINNGLSIQMQTTFGTEIADIILQANETTLTTSDGSSTARGSIIMHPTGDVGLIATDGATYTDSIYLNEHDGILKADSVFIRDGSLGAASPGYVWTLQNARGYGKWVAASGSTPNLQAVTTAGNTTLTAITAESFSSKPSYTSDFVASLGFSGNGTTAQGVVSLREVSTGGGQFAYLQSVDVLTADRILKLPDENDTLATHQWVLANVTGGGGWGTTGTIATLTGASTLDLDGNAIVFSSGGNNFLTVDPTQGSELVYLNATNATGGGNFGQLTVDASATVGEWEIAGQFNAGAKEAKIFGVADATTSTLGYTADTHTFNATDLFKVTNGASDFLLIDPDGFNTQFFASDGVAGSTMTLDGDLGGTNVKFRFIADDGTNPIIDLKGDAIAQTITLTAANGILVNTGIIRGDALHNNAFGQGSASQQDVRSGTYTPTLTNVTNVAASTAYACQWIRVGNVVTVSGKVDIDVTLGIASELGMSLPITSALAADENLGGTASSAAAASLVSAIRADATNDRAAFVFTAVSLTNDSYSFEFTYLIL